MSIQVVYNGFDENAIKKTVKQKSKDVVGESFVIDWSLPGYKDFKESFEALTDEFVNIFGNCFVKQINHHSTILSKRLDPIDISNDFIVPVWMDNDFSVCRRFFSENFCKLILESECCVIAKAGTVQLVFRDENVLPKARNLLNSLGASVKPGTIDGDFINTCTVVLGYLQSIPHNQVQKEQLESATSKWNESYHIDKVKVHTISLVRYFDLSLNNYLEIEKF
ncbi:MAG TPA: hypothetical protein DCQ37_03855 [Desulfobacteraceae bacterium]|nr:hypothetical protein [Desulfobacteraceae bacterium]